MPTCLNLLAMPLLSNILKKKSNTMFHVRAVMKIGGKFPQGVAGWVQTTGQLCLGRSYRRSYKMSYKIHRILALGDAGGGGGGNTASRLPRKISSRRHMGLYVGLD